MHRCSNSASQWLVQKNIILQCHRHGKQALFVPSNLLVWQTWVITTSSLLSTEGEQHESSLWLCYHRYMYYTRGIYILSMMLPICLDDLGLETQRYHSLCRSCKGHCTMSVYQSCCIEQLVMHQQYMYASDTDGKLDHQVCQQELDLQYSHM